MHRIEGTYYDSSGGTNLFQDTSSGGTRVTAAWLNAVQEELCNILTGLGGTVTTAGADTSRNQLYSIMATAGIAAPATSTTDPLSSNGSFTTFYGTHKTFFLNPDAARNFDPSGTFVDGVQVNIVNINGTFAVTFDSGTLAESVAANTAKSFIYDGTNSLWKLLS